MKKISVISVFFIIFIFTDSYASQSRELIIVAEEFPPFEFEHNKKVVGIDIDIASYIFKKMNIPFKFQIIPWRRAWSMVESGRADAVLSTSRKETRKPYLIYPEVNMWMSEFVFFVKRDHYNPKFFGYQTAIDQHLKIGIIRGNSYHPSFWKAFPYINGATSFQGDNVNADMHNHQLDIGSNVETNIKKLIGGRFDLFPCDKIIGMYTAKLLGIQDKLTYYKIVLFSKGYPMPFVKKSSFPHIQQVAAQFEKELKIFKQSSQHQKIIDKWLQ